MGGLHDDRQRDPGFPQPREHAETIEIRHDEVEHHHVDGRAIGAGEDRDRRVAAFGHQRVVAEAADHALDEPALYRVVVDDQNALTHDATSDHQGLCRNEALSPITLNAVLSPTPRSRRDAQSLRRGGECFPTLQEGGIMN